MEKKWRKKRVVGVFLGLAIFVLCVFVGTGCKGHKHEGVPAPVADFTGSPLSGSTTTTFTFTDASTGTITSWSWDFGSDASPATADTQGPHSVTYSTEGLKTVSLIVTGPGGTDEEVKANYITVFAAAFVKTWGGSAYDAASAIALDSAGNIYCAGSTESFGAGSSDALLLKYNSSGALQWAKTWGRSGQDWLHAVAVDSDGNIYCGGGTFPYSGYEWSDALLLKYDSSGALQWAKTWGVSDNDNIYAIAVDSLGNIYCAGFTYPSPGEYDALLLKYDSSGALQWARSWGKALGDLLMGVAVDSLGNIYCAGITYPYAGKTDGLLLKYDSSGALQWAKTWGGGSPGGNLCAIAVDSLGNIYCVGNTYSFGAGSSDAVLLKYDSSGALQWAKTWGGASMDVLYGVGLDSGGNICCAGYTSSFGAGGQDALLLKYDSSGALQCAKTWGGSSNDWLNALAVDSTGNLYFGGYTYSYTGVWQEVTGSQTTPTSTASPPTGTPSSPSGTQTSPTGTQTSPTGSETGAGDSDTLLLKNW